MRIGFFHEHSQEMVDVGQGAGSRGALLTCLLAEVGA